MLLLKPFGNVVTHLGVPRITLLPYTSAFSPFGTAEARVTVRVRHIVSNAIIFLLINVKNGWFF